MRPGVLVRLRSFYTTPVAVRAPHGAAISLSPGEVGLVLAVDALDVGIFPNLEDYRDVLVLTPRGSGNIWATLLEAVTE